MNNSIPPVFPENHKLHLFGIMCYHFHRRRALKIYAAHFVCYLKMLKCLEGRHYVGLTGELFQAQIFNPDLWCVFIQFSSVQSLSCVRLFATPWTAAPGFPVCHWRVRTERGPLEKGMANHFSILALRTQGIVWCVFISNSKRWNSTLSRQSNSSHLNGNHT